MLNLIVLRANEPEVLTHFYEGFGWAFVKEGHGGGPIHYAYERNGSVFEIYPRSAKHPSTTSVRLGFVVEDLTKVCSETIKRAGSVVSAPRPSSRGLEAVVRDPEGHTLALVELS